jgi:uncharacterized protein YbaP (TraB family)
VTAVPGCGPAVNLGNGGGRYCFPLPLFRRPVRFARAVKYSGNRGAAGRFLLLLLAFLIHIFFPLRVACEEPAPLFMWHVSTENVHTYLLGTIHVLSPDFYPLPPVIEEIIENTDLLVMEADPDPGPDEFSLITELTYELGFYHDGTTLKDHIPGPSLDLLLARADRYGLPPEQLKMMKPWLITLTLEVLELGLCGFLPEYGMEAMILQSFSGPVYELEGAEFQIRLFSALTDSDQLLFLQDTLEKLFGTEDEVNRYLQAWKDGNTDILENLLSPEGSSADMEDVLIHRRNLSMTDKIESLISCMSGNILVLAGALHFAGDTGIPRLLSNRGFRVEQVMSDGSLGPIPE